MRYIHSPGLGETGMRGYSYFGFTWAAAAAAQALALAPDAHAIKGAYLLERDFPVNVCKISFFGRGSSHEPNQTCTGTLIAKNRVVTAAHCDLNLRESPDAFVKCGRDGGITTFNFGMMVKGHIRAPWHTPEGKLHDLAVFELDSVIDLPIVPLVESLQQSQDIQQNLANCRIFGFGKDNYYRTGISHGAQFQPRPELAGSHPFSIVTGPNRATPGDSGGPVLCPVTANGVTQWIQLAVTVSIPANQRIEISFHELLENHLEWLRGVARTSQLPGIDRR